MNCFNAYVAVASRVPRFWGYNDEYGDHPARVCPRPRGTARDQRERSSRRTRPHMTAHAVRTLVRPALSRSWTEYVRYAPSHQVFFFPISHQRRRTKRESRQLGAQVRTIELNYE